MSNFTCEQIINTWKEVTNEMYGANKYSNSSRMEILATLFIQLVDNQILQEDIEFSKTEVCKYLITDEGLKNKGKHKGWYETIQQQFDATLVKFYKEDVDIIQDVPKKEIINTPQSTLDKYGKYPYLKRNDIVTKWAMKRFGSAWNEELNLLVHQHHHMFYMEFQRDTFGKKQDLTK